MIIKKHSNKNNYLLSKNNIWIRDFTKKNVNYLDLNNLIPLNEQSMMLDNEHENSLNNYVDISSEDVIKRKVVIVSDGFNFEEKHLILSDLPSDVCIICTNKALAKWKLIGNDCINKKAISFYVVNNPYEECLNYYSAKKYYPKCIASTRTNPKFLENYNGNIFTYAPSTDANYSGKSSHHQYKIDDYRNPICAAIGLAYRFGVEKLLLFCCDDSFAKERSSAIPLQNGLWSYQRQIDTQQVIDANLFWLKNKNIQLGNCSNGITFENAAYIPEDGIVNFFNKEENE